METDKLNIDEILGKVQRVSTPPFLMTRIESRLEARHKNAVIPRLVFATLVILVLVNILIINSNRDQTMNSESMPLLDEMNVKTTNQFYYE